MINVVFNGEARSFQSDLLADCLAEIKTGKAPSAVAVNRAFVPRSDYATTRLNDGDNIELLVPMQGG